MMVLATEKEIPFMTAVGHTAFYPPAVGLSGRIHASCERDFGLMTLRLQMLFLNGKPLPPPMSLADFPAIVAAAEAGSPVKIKAQVSQYKGQPVRRQHPHDRARAQPHLSGPYGSLCARRNDTADLAAPLFSIRRSSRAAALP
jgi:hypothetical protein